MSDHRYFKNPEGNVRRVKTGFNWLAFLFGALWAFANRAWLLGIFLLVPTLAFSFAEDPVYGRFRGAAGPLIMMALYTILMYVCGKNGNAWLASSLKSKGYREVRGDAV
jgi:hypothetical protein